jgi:hypothetical protein
MQNTEYKTEKTVHIKKTALIKMNIKETGRGGVDMVDLFQDIR